MNGLFLILTKEMTDLGATAAKLFDNYDHDARTTLRKVAQLIAIEEFTYFGLDF